MTATGDPGRRVEVNRADELGRLAASFNTMLGALQRSLTAQRQLVSDASHELRTPLTSLQLNAELLAAEPSLPEPGLSPGHDRLVDPVEGGRTRAPGEGGEQRDPRLRRLGLDPGYRLLDPVPFQGRRHRHVVVADLHDDQRRLERAQVGPGDLGGDRSLLAEARVYVAGPGNPVHEGVPVQLAGQQHGPGPGRITRPHSGGDRRADDRDYGHTGPSAG